MRYSTNLDFVELQNSNCSLSTLLCRPFAWLLFSINMSILATLAITASDTIYFILPSSSTPSPHTGKFEFFCQDSLLVCKSIVHQSVLSLSVQKRMLVLHPFSQAHGFFVESLRRDQRCLSLFTFDHRSSLCNFVLNPEILASVRLLNMKFLHTVSVCDNHVLLVLEEFLDCTAP